MRLLFCIRNDVVTVRMSHWHLYSGNMSLINWKQSPKEILDLSTFQHKSKNPSFFVPLFYIMTFVNLMASKKLYEIRILWVLSVLKPHTVMNACPTEAVRNQSVLARFLEVTNEFPLGFTVSPAHITPTANPVTTLLSSFLPGEQSRSITETDRCLWLGCCIRLFDEVTTISRCWEGAETPWTSRPQSKQEDNRKTGLRVKVGFYWLTVVMSNQKAIIIMNENQCCNIYSRPTGYKKGYKTVLQ